MIYGFMHVALMNNGYEIFKEQAEKIQYSGLYDKCEKIFIGCVHSEKSSKSYFEDLPDKFIQVIDHPDIKIAELLTVNELINFSKKNDHCKIWYIHTKGAAFPKLQHKRCWRRHMEYFNIVKHEDRIKDLDDYDICGVEWVVRNIGRGDEQFFTGNFWWVNSEYASKSDFIMIKKPYDRYLAERILTINKKTNYKSVYTSLGRTKILNDTKPFNYIKIKM